MSVSADFYNAQARHCAQSAAGCALANERDKYLRAEAAWQALADRERGITAARAEREARRLAEAADAATHPN